MPGVFDQSAYDIRFGWGAEAVDRMAPISDAVIIVDVLSFSTSVDIATGRGAIIYPFAGRGPEAVDYARARQALLASKDRTGGAYSLAPASLVNIPPGTRLVMPSPNGSTLSMATGSTPTFAGCLRNARAVAAAAARRGTRVAVIAAGERWRGTWTLRPALEDLLGAGSIIAALLGGRSPEAEAAAAVFSAGKVAVGDWLRRCASGLELAARGSGADVDLAAQLDVSQCVPVLQGGAYSDLSAG